MLEKFAFAVICLIISAVWAFFADLIAKHRGYTSMLYFWLGFFFWPFGVFIAALQPDLYVDKPDHSHGADIRVKGNDGKPILGVVENWYQQMPVGLLHNQIIVNRNRDHAYLILTFLNRGDKIINSLHLQITCLDDCGDPIGSEPVIYHAYQDLAVLPGEKFGDKRNVLLPSSFTRRVQIMPVKMLFSDGTILRAEDIDLSDVERLPQLRLLKKKSPYEQFFVDKYGEKNNEFPALYIPEKLDEQTWSCFCGKVNSHGDICERCGRSKEKTFAVYNEEFMGEKLAELMTDQEEFKYYRFNKGLE